MKVSAIWVYPIKGLGGCEVDFAFADESGLENDRRLMLVDKNNTFISQRTHPRLATLATTLNGNLLKVSSKADKLNALEININSTIHSDVIIASVWKSRVESLAFDKNINDWFSNYLNDEVKLVKQSNFGNRHRWVNGKKIGMAYADGYPFLVLSKESVQDLSERMNEEIDYRQFRANIIVEDCAAFDEDKLEKFTISDASFKMVKPCKRCSVIDIHQDTGEFHQKVVKTLQTYRREKNSIIFGMNAAIVNLSLIHI